jgi:hypothetical protein
MRYEKYAQSMVERGWDILDEPASRDVKEWACAVCGKHFFGMPEGPLYFSTCWLHPAMRMPTLAESAYAKAEGLTHGPDTPPAVQMIQYAEERGKTALTFYRWDDGALDPSEWQKLSGSHLVKLDDFDRPMFEGDILVEVPYTTWGEYAGDDITRHNYEYWLKNYEGQAWWYKAEWYQSRSIVVSLVDMTQEVCDEIVGLIESYCSLDDDGLYETQQKLQEAAWDAYLRYEWPDVLRAACDKFDRLGTDVGEKCRARLEEILEEDGGKALLWECERRDDTGDVWVYEDGESATMRKMEDVARNLAYEDLFPPDPNQPDLPGLEAETLGAAEVQAPADERSA